MSLNTLPKQTSRTTVDINKIAYANFFYRNQDGDEREILPCKPSVHGTELLTSAYYSAFPHPDFPDENLLQRAVRLGILDTWKPIFKCTLSNGHTLEFTGEKAKQLNQAWRSKLFGKKDK